MQLFLVHAGYYDRESFSSIFEMHLDFFVVAEDFEDAKLRAKAHPDFKKRKMHLDGLLIVEAVDGFRIKLEKDESLGGETQTAQTPDGWRALNRKS